MQRDRFAGHEGVAVNADAEGELLESITALTEAAAKLVADIAQRFRLSARAYHRVLRVARTIADLEGSDAGREAARRRGRRLPPRLLTVRASR